MPEYIDVEIRLSRAPAHLNVNFKNGRAYRAISFRPERRHSAAWALAEYNDALSTDGTRVSPL